VMMFISTLKLVVYHVFMFFFYSQPKVFDLYEFKREIGRGGYGYVYEVKRKNMDKQYYALKIVKLIDRYYYLSAYSIL